MEMVTKEQVKKIIENNKQQSQKILENKDEFDQFLRHIESKLNSLPIIGADFAVVPAMVSLLKSYVTGAYKKVPYGTLVAIVGSLLYLINPFDLIPDAIPGVGILDDAAVIKICLELVKVDLQAYKEWENHLK